MRPVRKIFDKLEKLQGGMETCVYVHFSTIMLYCTVQLENAGIHIEPVTTEDLNSALVHTKPSARQLGHKYTEWQKEYESV